MLVERCRFIIFVGMHISRKLKSTAVFLITILFFVGIVFAIPPSSNAVFQFVFPFAWIAAAVLGPGPVYCIPILTVGLQTLIYASVLSKAWLYGFFLKCLASIAVVHGIAVLLAFVPLPHLASGY